MSNWFGFMTSCMQRLSTMRSSAVMFGYSLAMLRKHCRKRPSDSFMMLALCTAVTRLRPCVRAYSKPKRAMASEPTKYFSHSTSTPAHSMIETTAAVTSGPMPSPGRSVILCWAIGRGSFQPLARLREREIHREEAGQLGVAGELVEAAADAGERGGDEVEVVQAPALDGLPGEGAEDFQGALQERLEVAAAVAAVALQELRLAVAEDLGHAAVAEERGHVVRVRTHSQVLIIDHVNIMIKQMRIL